MVTIKMIANIHLAEKEVASIEFRINQGQYNPMLVVEFNGIKDRFNEFKKCAASLGSTQPSAERKIQAKVNGTKVIYLSKEERDFRNRVKAVNEKITLISGRIDKLERGNKQATLYMIETNILNELKMAVGIESSRQIVYLDGIILVANSGNTTAHNILKSSAFRLKGAGEKRVAFKTLVKSYIKTYSDEILNTAVDTKAPSYLRYEMELLKQLFPNQGRLKMMLG